MIKKILFLTSVLFTVNCFAGLQEDKNSCSSDTICSSTECYTILKELGEGAFGKVYAVENSYGERYAIKSYKIQTDPYLANHTLANAEREYMRGQFLDHSNIVKTFDLFEINPSQENHTTYLVLELVEGTTLYGIPKKSLALDQALHSSLQFVDALRYALSQKFLYLDLHRNNIMLSDLSDAMVIDLASFYSFDEVFDFLKKDKEKEKELKEKQLAEEQQIKEGKPKIAQNQLQAQKAIIKEHKLNKFFVQHPKLLEKIQKAKKKNKKEQHIPSKEAQSIDPDQMQMMPLLSHYFNDITEICVHFITKSDLSREEKLRMRVAIKMLAWNYSEDVDDDLFIPIDYYLEQLIDILQS